MENKYKKVVLKSALTTMMAASIPFLTISCHDDDETGSSNQSEQVLPQKLKVGDKIVISYNEREDDGILLVLSDTQLEYTESNDDKFKEFFNYTYEESGDSYIITLNVPVDPANFVALANDALADNDSVLSEAVNNLSEPATYQEIGNLESALDDIHPDVYVDYDENNDFFLENKYIFSLPKTGSTGFSFSVIGDYLVFDGNDKIMLGEDAFQESDAGEDSIKYIPVSK